MTKEDAKEIVALFGYKSSNIITIDDNYFIFRKDKNLFLIVTDEDNAEIYDLTDSSHTDIVSAGNILLEMVNKASETTEIPLFTIAYDSSSGKAWIEETGDELGDFEIIKLSDDDLMKLCLDNELDVKRKAKIYYFIVEV